MLLSSPPNTSLFCQHNENRFNFSNIQKLSHKMFRRPKFLPDKNRPKMAGKFLRDRHFAYKHFGLTERAKAYRWSVLLLKVPSSVCSGVFKGFTRPEAAWQIQSLQAYPPLFPKPTDRMNRGYSLLKGDEMVVGKFEWNHTEKGDQCGRGTSFFGSLEDYIPKQTKKSWFSLGVSTSRSLTAYSGLQLSNLRSGVLFFAAGRQKGRLIGGYQLSVERNLGIEISHVFPSQSEVKPKQSCLARTHFPALQVRFWLVHWIVCVFCDWPEWLHWFWFYDTQLKIAVIRTNTFILFMLSLLGIAATLTHEQRTTLFTCAYVVYLTPASERFVRGAR